MEWTLRKADILTAGCWNHQRVNDPLFPAPRVPRVPWVQLEVSPDISVRLSTQGLNVSWHLGFQLRPWLDVTLTTNGYSAWVGDYWNRRMHVRIGESILSSDLQPCSEVSPPSSVPCIYAQRTDRPRRPTTPSTIILENINCSACNAIKLKN